MKTTPQLIAFAACFGLLATPVIAAPTDNPFADFKKPFRVSVNLTQGWDSNPNAIGDEQAALTGEDQEESLYTSASIGINKVFGGPRTQLSLGLDTGVTYYWNLDENDLEFPMRLTLGLTHRVSPRLQLALDSYASYQMEPSFDPGFVSSVRRDGYYLYNNNALRATYQITNRVSSVTSYSLVLVRYDSEAQAEIENRIEQFVSEEIRFLLLPTTSLMAEYRLGIISYQDNSDRDSISNYALAGIDHSFTPRLRAALRGGVEFRDVDGGEQETSPYGELTVSYNISERTSLSWVSRYGLEQSDLVGSNASNTSLRTGLSLRQQLSRKVSLNAGAFYQLTQYEDRADVGSFDDQTLDLSANLSYQLGKNLSLSAGYSYTDYSSDEAFRDYDRQRVFLGLGATF